MPPQLVKSVGKCTNPKCLHNLPKQSLNLKQLAVLISISKVTGVKKSEFIDNLKALQDSRFGQKIYCKKCKDTGYVITITRVVKSFTCEHCGQNFRTKENYTKHRKELILAQLKLKGFVK